VGVWAGLALRAAKEAKRGASPVDGLAAEVAVATAVVLAAAALLVVLAACVTLAATVVGLRVGGIAGCAGRRCRCLGLPGALPGSHKALRAGMSNKSLSQTLLAALTCNT
jgi:predicted cobalt transporter CbtA